MNGNLFIKWVDFDWGISSSLVRRMSVRKAPLGSILGLSTYEVLKVCSFLFSSAGSTWPHKDRQRWLHYVNAAVTRTWIIPWIIPWIAKCECRNNCELCSFLESLSLFKAHAVCCISASRLILDHRTSCALQIIRKKKRLDLICSEKFKSYAWLSGCNQVKIICFKILLKQ